MKNHVTAWTIGLALAAGLVTTAPALDTGRTRTAAAVLHSPTGAPVIQLNFAAELRNVPDVTQSGVVLGWATVGGVEPTPFRVLIPAACFAGKRALYVEDFKGCGVQIMFGSDARRPLPLAILDFAARLLPQTDGWYRLDVLARVMDTELLPAVLGALGGSAVQIVIGRGNVDLPADARRNSVGHRTCTFLTGDRLPSHCAKGGRDDLPEGNPENEDSGLAVPAVAAAACDSTGSC